MTEDRDALLRRLEDLEATVRSLRGARNMKGRLSKNEPVLDLDGIQRRIRQGMLAANMRTQLQLAQAAGLQQGQLSRMLNGKRMGAVTAETLVRIATALNVYVGWLIAGEGEPRVPPGPSR